MRSPLALLLTLLALLALVTTQACSDSVSNQQASRATVAAALDTLVAELAADRLADAAAYAERLQAYLAHPGFFGSAAALLDRSGAVIASPYVYRTGDGCAIKDLAVPPLPHRGPGLVHGATSRERWRLDGPLP